MKKDKKDRPKSNAFRLIARMGGVVVVNVGLYRLKQLLFRYLQFLMGQFNDGADLLIKKLSHKADGKTEVVMLDELDRTTLDIIAKVKGLV